MEQPYKFTNCVLQFSSSSEDEEINNYHHYNLNSNLLNSSLSKKPIPTPRAKHSINHQSKPPQSNVNHSSNHKQTFNQRNLIKNLNQQQVSDSTFTPKVTHKQLFLDQPNFVRTGSLDRKFQDVRKLNFSEMKLRLKQQQQQIEQNLLKKNLLLKSKIDSSGDNLSIQKPHDANEWENDILKNLNHLNDLSEKTNLHIKPPTPPQHKGQVWENKFYKLALNSINQITSETTQNRHANNDEHWYLSNCGLSSDLTNVDNFKNEFLQINQLPLYKNLNHTIARIDNLNENEILKIDTIDFSTSNHELQSTQDDLDNEFNDYDLPPDAYKDKTNNSLNTTSIKQATIIEEHTFSRNDQLRQSKFIERQIEPLEKNGYLLCNKNKKFKQRYFVLKNNTIFYYKQQSDVKKNKLKGTIRLDKDVNVIRNENSSSFQIIVGKKSSSLCSAYTLVADSVLTMEEWVRVIKNSLKRIDEKSSNKNIDLESWVIRRKNGYSKKFWLILKERKLYFHKSPSTNQPSSYLDLNEVKVLESVLEKSRDSFKIANDLLGDNRKEYVISLESNCKECQENTNSNPIYLVLNDKKTYNDWLYHLTILTIENLSNLTDFEKIIYKLMSIPVLNNDHTDLDSNQLWNDQLMVHSKESLNQPLTSLESISLKNEALKLFKSIQLFIMVKMNVNSGIDYHVALAQTSVFEICFEYPRLQKELFYQLVKQSTTSSNDYSNCKEEFRFIQSLQLLSLAVSVFEPKGKVLWLLKNFLRRKANDETECGKYAIYSQRTLERCLTNGCRETKPSRLEILAILLRNPYQHSSPFSIPVYFTNDSYIVVSFDGLTTIEEYAKQICEQSDIRTISQSGYALYSDDPIDSTKVHFLPWKCKLGDIISRWESSLKNNNLGKFESKRVIKLTFKKRLFFKSNTKTERDKEKLLFVYQLNQDLLNNRIPLSPNSDIPLHLAALLILLENGRAIDEETISKGINKFYPKNLREEKNQENLVNLIRFLINQMNGLTKKECIKIYLNCLKKWPIFGCSLFEATILERRKKVYLTVDETYFYILDVDLKIISNYYLNKFLKFGHKEDKLRIHLFNRSSFGWNSSRASFLNSSASFNNEKLEFQMDKEKINEFILLIADYLNLENSIKFERLTSESNSFATQSPFEFSPTNELPNSSLYDIKQLNNSNSLKEDQEYSEIYSPSYENNDFASTSSNSMPPTLPVHRCFTWEKNLYELCQENFNQFIHNTENHQQHDSLFSHSKDNEQPIVNQINQIKNRNSIGSMISGEYFTNQFGRRDLSNEFSSLDVSQYSLSKCSLTKKSSMSRCNSDNSSSGFLNDENLTLKDSLLVMNKKMKFKKRIVLIRNNTIYCFKNEYDLNKNKCKDKFKITSKTQLEEDENYFKLIDNQTQRSIAISCENQIKLRQCITLISSLLEKLNFKNVENLDSIIEGWITFIKNGICTRKWCKLKDKILFLYDESDDEASLILNLTENNIEEAESNDYEFVDWTQSFNIERKKEFSISIESSDFKADTVYLVFNEKKDFDIWFYHLSIAGNKVLDPNPSEKSFDKLLDKQSNKQRNRSSETNFEQIISKLMKIEYDDGLIALESSYLWNEPEICSINESINQPLTTLKSITLNNEALKLYKSIQLFIMVKMNVNSGIDYHISLAQSSIELCLDYPELQNEFYCQIIKLSNFNCNSSNLKLMRMESSETKLLNSNQTEDHSTLQALQLLSIAVSIFIPKGKILWFFKHFLRRQSDEHSNSGKYAIYCSKALERAMQTTGNRELKPSRMEVLGILLRNPNQHSSAHSIPVHFLNDEYLVVGFDGSTTIEEFTNQVRKEAGLSSGSKTQYVLYCDDPIIESHYDHYLQADIKLADVISQWEQCLRKKLGRFENNRVLKLTLKLDKFDKKINNDKDKIFLAYKICDNMRKGQFPANHDLAIQFIALLAQSQYGNLENNSDKLIETMTNKFYPIVLKSKVHPIFLQRDLKAKWNEIKNATTNDCIRVLINCAKKWPLFGSTLFKAKSTKPIKVELTLSKYILPSDTLLWLAIGDNHFSILDFNNYQQIYQFELRNLIKFGCHQADEFIFVIKKCNDEFEPIGNHSINPRLSLNTIRDINYERFIFKMEKSQIYQLTQLMKDYLEADLSIK